MDHYTSPNHNSKTTQVSVRTQNPGPSMADHYLLRRVIHRSIPLTALCGGKEFLSFAYHEWRHQYAATTSEKETQPENEKNNKKNKWFTLPPFTSSVDGGALGKTPAGQNLGKKEKASTTNSTMTAIKWVARCCPELPRSLVQKLFRLRQVRRESSDDQIHECRPKRVGAKDVMNYGDRIHLPVTVEKSPSVQAKAKVTSSEEEMKFLHSLIIYKDPAIIAVNKPPGMPVQGGIGVKRSLDELAAEYLRFNDSESPRLVHRLDRDCSGVLVLGRTQLSASALHSIFREKTCKASHDLEIGREIIRKTYWALVIGSPRRSEGLISAPLQKIVIENGKFERITVVDNVRTSLAQSAVTEYRIIGSPCHGYTWLELSPLTGRKHQLRVHCAEVLGTPIVGDYKYGWQAHKNLKPFPCSTATQDLNEEFTKKRLDQFGLNFWSGSIFDKQPRLHLHCKEMILPDISLAVQCAKSVIDFDIEDLESIKLDAPLSSHMQKSRELLYS